MNIDKNWWEGQSQWKTNIIQANGTGRRSRYSRWVFFLVLLGVVGFVLYDSREDLLAHYYAGEYTEMHELIIILFPLLFLITQVKKIYKRSKYGDTPLVMNPFPSIIGETFSGYVEINKKVDGLQFSAELLLMQHIEVEEDDYSESQTDIVWRMPVELQQERAMLGARLLVKAQLPAKKPPSQSPHTDDYYSWCLYVYSKDKSFKRRWSIPIIAKNEYV
ncbi:MAG: hypothetical protein ACRBBR_04895 [Cellvibrionaceae bacterium]